MDKETRKQLQKEAKEIVAERKQKQQYAKSQEERLSRIAKRHERQEYRTKLIKESPSFVGKFAKGLAGSLPKYHGKIGGAGKVRGERQVVVRGVGRPSGLFKPRIDPRTGQVVRMPALQFNAMMRNWRAMQKARIERQQEAEKLRQLAMSGRQNPQNPQFQAQQQQFQRMPQRSIPMPQRMQPQPFRRQFQPPQMIRMRQNMPIQRYPVQPQQEFREDQDLMTGRRFLRLKPKKEAWLS